MTDESQDRPVLSVADRMLLKSAAAPTDAQLEATRRALGSRLAALAAGAAVAQVASTAEATGAAVGSAAATTATAAATKGLAALGTAKWISAGLIVTAIAGGTVVATRRSPEAPHAAAAIAAPPPQAVAAPKAAPELVAPRVAAAEQQAPSIDDVATEATTAPAARRSATRSARRDATDPKPARALEGETLAAELALMHSARQALARGDAGAALQALDSHASRFPNAVLQQEALSARALALCAAGKPADARRTAAQLARLAPRSPHLIRLADSCAIEDADPSP